MEEKIKLNPDEIDESFFNDLTTKVEEFDSKEKLIEYFIELVDAFKSFAPTFENMIVEDQCVQIQTWLDKLVPNLVKVNLEDKENYRKQVLDLFGIQEY